MVVDVTERTQSSLKFRWNTLECGERHGPEVIYHYRLESPSGLYWNGQVHDPESLAAVYGLLPCLTYSFKVQAETSAGFGEPSNLLFAGTTASRKYRSRCTNLGMFRECLISEAIGSE